jgi:hypothetical protein
MHPVRTCYYQDQYVAIGVSPMKNSSKTILNQALELPENERAILAEQLLISLNLPDSEIDEQWANEAENRIDQYEKGNIATRSAQEVFGKYKK